MWFFRTMFSEISFNVVSPWEATAIYYILLFLLLGSSVPLSSLPTSYDITMDLITIINSTDLHTLQGKTELHTQRTNPFPFVTSF